MTAEARPARTAQTNSTTAASQNWYGFKDGVTQFQKRVIGYLKHGVDWKSAGILLLIVLFHAANNIVVVSLDTAPRPFAESSNFITGGNVFDAVQKAHRGAFLSSIREPYPPLIYLMAVPFYAVFGSSLDVAIISTIPAALVLALSMYHLGKSLTGKGAGLLAAGLALLMPGIFAFSRTYQYEFTLVAFLALSLALMLKSEGFSKRGYSLAFGAAAGAGLLVNWSFPLYLVGPALFYCYRTLRGIFKSYKNPLRECLRRGTVAFLALMLCALIVGPWYVWNRAVVVSHVKKLDPLDRSFVTLSGENILYYLSPLYKTWLGPGIFILLLASLIPQLKSRWKDAWLGTAWFAVPFFFFTFAVMWKKNPRFLVPALPGLALLISQGTDGMGAKWKRKLRLAAMAIALSQFFLITYLAVPINPSLRISFGSPSLDRRDWRVGEVAGTLNDLLASRPEASVAIIHSYHPYTLSTLWSLQRTGVLTFDTFSIRDVDPYSEPGLHPPLRPREYFEDLLADTEVFLLPEPDYLVSNKVWNNFLLAWNTSRPSFIRVMKTVLPDGTVVEIYARGVSRDLLYAQNEAGDFPRNASLYFTVPIQPEERPLGIVLEYQISSSSLFQHPHYRVEVNGIPLANLSAIPLPPWTEVSIMFPREMLHNDTLEIEIVGRAADADNSSIVLKKARVFFW